MYWYWLILNFIPQTWFSILPKNNLSWKKVWIEPFCESSFVGNTCRTPWSIVLGLKLYYSCLNVWILCIVYTVKLNTSMHSVLNKRFQKIMQWMLSCNSLLFKSIFRLSTIPFLNITCLDARPAPDSWRHHLSDFETLVRTEENPKVTPGNWNTRNICFSWYFACQIIRQRYMSWIFLKKGLI